jgi:hypothetical protein
LASIRLESGFFNGWRPAKKGERKQKLDLKSFRKSISNFRATFYEGINFLPPSKTPFLQAKMMTSQKKKLQNFIFALLRFFE